MSEASASVDPDTWIGKTLAERYHLTQRIGEGGIGTVYLADDTVRDTKVAIKLLRPTTSKEASARLEREAEAMATLVHPNIVHAFGFGHATNGSPYIIMELAAGETLRSVLRRIEELPVDTAFQIARQVGAGLSHAHGLGIVHRDLKPENIMVEAVHTVPRVKMLDFGMARLMGGAFGHGPNLTREGTVFGTADYMSPEQAMGKPADERSDQYAFGVILFEMFAGRRPFSAPTRIELVQLQIRKEAPRLVTWAPWVPSSVSDVVGRMLQKDPAERFPDVSQAVEALEAAAVQPPPPAHTTRERTSVATLSPHWRITTAIVVAALATTLAVGLKLCSRSVASTVRDSAAQSH